MMRFKELHTPAFLIEQSRIEQNCSAMLDKAQRSEVIFRPHVKTHKTIEAARLQHGGETGPITVSTLAEARFFAENGFDDITYAVPIAPEKLAPAAALARTMSRLNLLVDHPRAAAAMVAFADAASVSFDVFLKVDCGYHRAGVDPKSSDAIELARILAAAPRLTFRGLLTHAGHSYHAQSLDELREIARIEAESLAEFRQLLREHEIEVETASVGSTPTASIVDSFEYCDEVRPGNYVFYDAYQAQLGSCSLDDVAVSVLATVIGKYPAQQKLIIDAGSLAVSREAPHDREASPHGIVCDLDLQPLDLSFDLMSQEHGQLFGHDFAQLEVGSRVRIIPNHSCITAAMYDEHFVVDGDEIVDEWRPVRGW